MTYKYKISVILSTHNRSELLLKCLESLANQSIDNSLYEIVLVDNYSNDNGNSTKKIYQKILDRYPLLNIKLILEKVIGGMTLSRHVAINNSNGEIIVCADDDYIAETGLLESALDCFSDKSIHAACGSLRPLYKSPPPKWINSLTTLMPDGGYYITDFTVIDHGDKSKDIEWQYMFWSNWAVRREIYEKLNGFGPDGFSGEFVFYNGTGEHFMNEEIARRGYRMVYCSGMSAFHHVSDYRYTKKYFQARYFHYGIVRSFEKINSKKNVDSAKEVFSFLLSFTYQMIRDLFKMPFILKFRMIWLMLGYLEHQQKVKKNEFLLNFCKLDNYKDFNFSKLIPFKNKRPNLW